MMNRLLKSSPLLLTALTCVAVAAGSLLAKPAEKAARFDPVARNIEGWTVHIDPALLEGDAAELGKQALGMLRNHLQRIAILMPEDRLEKLRGHEIWIEHHHPTLSSMQYHPGRDWLVENGHDERLVKKVHIPRAGALVSRSQMLKHPAVILHELAHAYHDQVLGFDHPEVVAAYEAAMKRGDYEQSLLFTGEVVKHYATTNHKEYFAEATESYFYHNDFYPFVRAELRQHDPQAYALMEKVWGKVD
jgi:dipeptidyl-peptidase-4